MLSSNLNTKLYKAQGDVVEAAKEAKELTSGSLADGVLYKLLDNLYHRGWTDNHCERDWDPRGTKEWQAALDTFKEIFETVATLERIEQEMK